MQGGYSGDVILWDDVIAVAATLFFIMDPLGNIPAFQAVLKKFDPKTRAKIIARELIIAFIVLLLFLLGGTKILGFLGLTQPSLHIAGGILLFIIALKMVFPGTEKLYDDYDEEPYIVPLAIPLIAGPSTIAMLLFLSSSQPQRIVEWTLALFLAWLLTTFILVFSPFMLRYLGNKVINALERLTGMILILISVQMFLDGLAQYIQYVK